MPERATASRVPEVAAEPDQQAGQAPGSAHRGLDFIVIGVQKGGTTSLWQLLRNHPSIAMPERKEASFFGDPDAGPSALAAHMEVHFGDAPAGALLGTATPQYMMGSERLGVREIAARISAALPDVRLIALLRDPIERAFSHYRMLVMRGLEERSFEAAIVDQLRPRRLVEVRRRAREKTGLYVVQGEYGRILAAYREHFHPRQLHVELTADLDSEPGEAIERILAFLSLPTGYRPERSHVRLYRGGRRSLLDDESRAELLEFMEENVWPNLGEEAARVRRLFGLFLGIWDIAPDGEPPALTPPTRAALEAHFAADAELLAELGFGAPWVESWRG